MDKFIISLLVVYGVIMLLMCILQYYIIILNNKKPINKVRFYVARDKNGSIYLYLGKPRRCSYNFVNLYGALGTIANEYHFKDFGLNTEDFKGLKWEDEPVEVFLTMED